MATDTSCGTWVVRSWNAGPAPGRTHLILHKSPYNVLQVVVISSGPELRRLRVVRTTGTTRLPLPTRELAMKAVAVLPGKPNSVHLRDVPAPALDTQPHPHVARIPDGRA